MTKEEMINRLELSLEKLETIKSLLIAKGDFESTTLTYHYGVIKIHLGTILKELNDKGSATHNIDLEGENK